MEFLQRSLTDLQSSLKTGETTSLDLVREAIQKIEGQEPQINALVRTDFKVAQEKAESLDLLRKKGDLDSESILNGIPIIVKDNLAIKGKEVTAASKILKGFISPYSATVIKKLEKAGAIILGQANMDEFAMGSSNETSCHGQTRNPRNHDKVPGGSSGGSAAAVAAGYAPVAIGSDTGGSIRQPASFCGVVGLKPTYGRVSRYGLFAYGSSLDQIGPITHHVDDARQVLKIIEGADPADSTSTTPEIPINDIDETVKGLKIGVPKEFMDTSKGLHPNLKSIFDETFAKLEKEGAVIEEISLPILDHVIPTYYLIANCEASSNLARYDSIRYGYRCENPNNLMDSYERSRAEGFGEEVKTRVILGTYALSAGYYDAFYKKADAIRQDMRHQLAEIYKKVDVIMGPTTPNVAFSIGEMTDDPLKMYMQDLYTTFVNLVSCPAISVPCGSSEGLPVGLQIVSGQFNENALFRAARAVENIRS